MIVKKEVRTSLLVLCTIIFIIAGTYAILTMQGLVFDFSNFKFTKSGSIYVNYTPTNGEFSINGEIQNKKQGLFGGGILTSNLVPKTYTISVHKDGYTPWTKTLSVDPGKVAVAARITLWKEIEMEPQSSSSISNFYTTDKGFILKTSTSSLLFNEEKIKGSSIYVSDMSSPYVITKTNSNTLFLIDLEKPTIARDFRVLWHTIINGQGITDKTQVIEVIFHPFNKSKLIVRTTKNLYSFDLRKNIIEPIEVGGAPTIIATSANEIWALNKNGDIYITNLILGSKYEFPVKISDVKTILPSRDGNFAFITTDTGDLFLFDRTKQTAEKISSDIVFTSFSPDGIRGLFINSANIAHIIYLNEYEGDAYKKEGTIEKIIFPKTAKTETFEWIPFAENYGLIKANNSIETIELDNRAPSNIATITKNVLESKLIHGDLFIVNTNNEFLKGTLEE